MLSELHEIKILIGSGETKHALDKLVYVLKDTNSNLLDASILIQSRFIEFEKKAKIEYTISPQEADIIYNQINHASLNLIDTILQKRELEYKIKNYIKREKTNKYLYATLLIPILALTLFLYKIYTESQNYKKELIKKEEYIKTLELKSDIILGIADNLKDDFPKLQDFVYEFKNLNKKHIEAVNLGNLTLKSEIVRQIHELPSRYGFDSMHLETLNFVQHRIPFKMLKAEIRAVYRNHEMKYFDTSQVKLIPIDTTKN